MLRTTSRTSAPSASTRPRMTVELMAHGDPSPHILEVGNPVPDDPGRVYVREAGGQDDVVIVQAGALGEIARVALPHCGARRSPTSCRRP